MKTSACLTIILLCCVAAVRHAGASEPFIEPQWSACSDVVVTQSGTILCLYGRDAQAGFVGDPSTVARFNPARVKGQR